MMFMKKKAEAEGDGVLSGRQIRSRLWHEDLRKRLFISPFIEPHIDEGTVDVRLGTRFIISQKTGYPIIDPLEIAGNPLKIYESQKQLKLEFGQDLILHPGQLVLGTTLEFVKIPNDLACYVVTRSSYGRLGLVTATAVFVHPGFRGCITLELINFGETPVVLCAGMRIAQLTVHKTNVDEPLKMVPKYNLPIGPEFPKIYLDEEDHRRLRLMRDRQKSKTDKAFTEH